MTDYVTQRQYGNLDFYGNKAANVDLENARLELLELDPLFAIGEPAGRFWFNTVLGAARVHVGGNVIANLGGGGNCNHYGWLAVVDFDYRFPAGNRGDVHAISSNYVLGNTVQVAPRDVVVCITDGTPAGNEAAAVNWSILKDWRSTKAYVDAASSPSYFKTVTAATSGTFDTVTGAELMQVTAYEGPPWVEVGIHTQNQSGVVSWSSSVPFTGIIVCTPVNLSEVI